MSDWRNVESQLLCALAEVSQVKVAQRMGLSEQAVSGLKAPNGKTGQSAIQTTAKLIAALGLKLVHQDAPVYTPEFVGSLETLVAELLRQRIRGQAQQMQEVE